MTSCISEPVSYVRLERYSLHELPADEHRRIAEHLAQCPVCRACYERIQRDERGLDLAALSAKLGQAPQLPAAKRARRTLWGAGALVASLACVLVVSRMRPDSQEALPGPALSASAANSKGDGLALELVRADAQGQLLEPTHFAAGDRFKLLLTCPPALTGRVRVLAFQGGDVFEPVPVQALANCGNRRALSGAWQFDGDGAVELCAVLAGSSAEQHVEEVRSPEALRLPHACAHLEPLEPEAR